MTFAEQVETERLLLRWCQETDAEEMYARYASDPVVARHMLWPPHESVAQTREFIRSRCPNRADGDTFNWLIRRRESGQLLGSIGCRYVAQHVVQFGYCLAQDSWGRGFATEACRALVPAWLAEAKVWRVQALCDLDNTASIRVLEKTGLSREGTLRRYIVTPNISNEPRDVHIYARVR